MNAVLRDILICLGVAVVMQVLLLGPFLALMIVTGGAVFAGPILAVIAIGALALDHFALRRGGIRGWPLSAAALGLLLNTAFNAITAGGTAP
ncbi:hypothetical protein [Hasllibacter sp. MH4015]|uniref:hypothetical protein n=1 Tax=Hasllibacter sp. MH4015 TaxID=2854029 RepID=UPI001CD5AB03|nr:hypothetical protein [Hasllibacter sp. MH4015]